MSLRIGLVGLGTIARAQHLPAIAATDGIDLCAVAGRNATADVQSYTDIHTMLAMEPALDAITLCTPPQGRFEQAMAALDSGRHLMLEKPPGATLSELDAMRREAARKGVTLFATWHSREAAAVPFARTWLVGKTIRAIHIDWREDVRKWHPGQEWIWRVGGLGVFDPGINALSILTALVKDVFLTKADLYVPAGCQTPIAVDLVMHSGSTPIIANFDWRETGDEFWRITIDTSGGILILDQGGALASIDGAIVAQGKNREYAGLYARFRDLIAAGQSDFDLAPFTLVADAFLNGAYHPTDPLTD